jgi:hypothetical protein
MMAEITDDAKLKFQMAPNPKTGELEVLVLIKGVEDEHGWFLTRHDLVNFLSHGKVTIPHAKKASPIEIAKTMPEPEKGH